MVDEGVDVLGLEGVRAGEFEPEGFQVAANGHEPVQAVGTGGGGAVRVVVTQGAEAEGEVVQGSFLSSGLVLGPPSRPDELVSVDGRPVPRRE